MQGKLHQYHLTRELAKKYSHVTYLASPTDEPECQVILTVFASSLFSLPHERKNVLQKAQRIQELEHPHLVPILDMGIEDEQPFVVREYLPHESLRSRLRTLSPDRLQLREVLMIVSQVGQALAYAHEHYLLHGNLKPENIFLDAHGEALLTDFSLVDRKDAILRDQTTEEYAFCYLAPEQFAGTSDARSDQYALGYLAYELMSGHVPFAARSLASLIGHQNNILLSPLSESIADLPPSLDRAILKTLAKDPAERFFDFSLFLEVIQSVLVQPPVFHLFSSLDSPRPKITFRRTSHRPKARTVLSSVHQITASSSPPSELPIVASGTYAAFFLSRTSKPDSLVHPTQVVNQALIPVQKSISPTQLAVLAACRREQSSSHTSRSNRVYVLDARAETTDRKQSQSE